MVERPPQNHPQQGQHTGEHERTLPAERRMRKVNNGRRQHRTDRETDTCPTGSNGALRFWEPFADGFGVSRGGGGFRGTHEEAQDSQMHPTPRTGVENTH
ncbi:hypothetical protein D3C80_1868500 [compost metagenome]